MFFGYTQMMIALTRDLVPWDGRYPKDFTISAVTLNMVFTYLNLANNVLLSGLGRS